MDEVTRPGLLLQTVTHQPPTVPSELAGSGATLKKTAAGMLPGAWGWLFSVFLTGIPFPIIVAWAIGKLYYDNEK